MSVRECCVSVRECAWSVFSVFSVRVRGCVIYGTLHVDAQLLARGVMRLQYSCMQRLEHSHIRTNGCNRAIAPTLHIPTSYGFLF